MSSKSVFIVGPGLIGWTLIDQLVEAGYTNISTLVRRKEHGDAIQKESGSNIKIIQGDLNDNELISKTTAEHDITFHTATADHVPSAQAVLDGIKQRADKGLQSVYIHTSGASLFADDSLSAYKSDKVYDDLHPEEIDALSPKAPHRDVDSTIVNFIRKENSDNIKAAIMIPPLIYGYNPKHDRLTIQIPALTRFALKHGHSGYLGAGLGVSGCIHVADLVRGYITILNNLLDPTTRASSFRENPYVLCENGYEYSWKEVAEHVGKSLKERNQIQVDSVKEIPRNEWDDLFGSWTPIVLGMNARAHAKRLRELGWEAKEKSLWDSWYQDELPALLRQDGKI